MYNQCPCCKQLITQELTCPFCEGKCKILKGADATLQICQDCGAMWQFKNVPGWIIINTGRTQENFKK